MSWEYVFIASQNFVWKLNARTFSHSTYLRFSDSLLLLLPWRLLRRWGLRSDWRWFSSFVWGNDLLDSHSLSEAPERISSLQLLKFCGSVLVQEFVDWQIAATNLDLNFVAFNFYHDSLGSEFVHTFGLSQEHNLQLLTIWVIVDIFSELLVSLISLARNVDGNSCFQVDDVVLKYFNFILSILEVFKKLKCLSIRLIALLLDANNVIGCFHNLCLKGYLVCDSCVFFYFKAGVLVFELADAHILFLAYLFCSGKLFT